MKCPLDGHNLEPVVSDHAHHSQQIGEVFQCTHPQNAHRFHMHMRDGQRILKSDDTGKDYAEEMFDIPKPTEHA